MAASALSILGCGKHDKTDGGSMLIKNMSEAEGFDVSYSPRDPFQSLGNVLKIGRHKGVTGFNIMQGVLTAVDHNHDFHPESITFFEVPKDSKLRKLDDAKISKIYEICRSKALEKEK